MTEKIIVQRRAELDTAKSTAVQSAPAALPIVMTDAEVARKNLYLYLVVLLALVFVLVGAYLLRTVDAVLGTAFTVAGTLISALAGLLTTKIAGEQNVTLNNQGATLTVLNKVLNDLKGLTTDQGKLLAETSKDTMQAIRQQKEDHTAMENTERFFLFEKLNKEIPVVYVRTDLDQQNKEGVPYTPVTEDYAAAILHLLFRPFGRELQPIGISAKHHQLNDKSTPTRNAEADLHGAEEIICFTAHAAVEKAGLDPSRYYVWLTEGKIIVDTPRQEGSFEDDIAANRYWGFLARVTQNNKTYIIMSGPTLRGVALVGAFLNRVIRHEGAMIKELGHPRFLEDAERDILFGKAGKPGEDFAAIIYGFFVGKTPIVNESTVKIAHIFAGDAFLKHQTHGSMPPSAKT